MLARRLFLFSQGQEASGHLRYGPFEKDQVSESIVRKTVEKKLFLERLSHQRHPARVFQEGLLEFLRAKVLRCR